MGPSFWESSPARRRRGEGAEWSGESLPFDQCASLVFFVEILQPVAEGTILLIPTDSGWVNSEVPGQLGGSTLPGISRDEVDGMARFRMIVLLCKQVVFHFRDDARECIHFTIQFVCTIPLHQALTSGAQGSFLKIPMKDVGRCWTHKL